MTTFIGAPVHVAFVVARRREIWHPLVVAWTTSEQTSAFDLNALCMPLIPGLSHYLTLVRTAAPLVGSVLGGTSADGFYGAYELTTFDIKHDSRQTSWR